MSYTIDKIKADLPDVPVCKTGALLEQWRCSGRTRPFAQLHDPNDPTRHCEVAWDTVLRVLNTRGAAVIL